jgi:hypothetical protein
MRGIHLLEDREQVFVLALVDRLREDGGDGVSVRLSARR